MLRKTIGETAGLSEGRGSRGAEGLDDMVAADLGDGNLGYSCKKVHDQCRDS